MKIRKWKGIILFFPSIFLPVLIKTLVIQRINLLLSNLREFLKEKKAKLFLN